LKKIDHIIPKYVYDKSFSPDSLMEVNDETSFEPRELESYSGMQMAVKQIKALDLGCVAIAQGSTQHYSRQKCMPSRHAWPRI
jgi:hypothetical protein